MAQQSQILLAEQDEENFVCLLEDNARRLGAQPALLWDGGELSWAELNQRASGFAHFLAGQGVGPGDRIATLIPNRWSFAVALLGILKLGATAATLHPTLRPEELAEVLADLQPRLLVDDVTADPSTRAPALAGGSCSGFRPTNFPVRLHRGICNTARLTSSPALIVYTSGSTGRPKGSVFSHSAFTFANRAWGGPVMGIKPDDVVLGVLPFAHNYGMNAGLLAPLLYGARVVIIEHFTPEGVLETIQKHGVTVLPGVATMFRRLLNSPALASADLSSLRLAVSGAAPCPWELCEEWRKKTGTRILRGYGMTEVPRPISYFADDPNELPDAIGRAIPDARVQVVDDEGRPLACGEVGELWINCPGATSGYLNAVEETRAVFRDGWFRTGDLASISPRGFVQIMGRKRERILRGGYSVFPQEIERVLLSHPAIAEAAVVGVPSPDLNEEVAAFVTLKPGANASAEELLDYCQGHLAHFKFPRYVTILEDLPKGASGKVVKAELLNGRCLRKPQGDPKKAAQMMLRTEPSSRTQSGPDRISPLGRQ
ncbi:MAG TPA: AMP-binding protein [Candidatus Limnocylindrales bacterium]|nr:AMP-binding protein [Candidatus Limnocylindrales bacterium]